MHSYNRIAILPRIFVFLLQYSMNGVKPVKRKASALEQSSEYIPPASAKPAVAPRLVVRR